MEKKLVLCDTNIFIEFYKNNVSIVNKLNVIGIDNIALSSVTVAELIFGALDKTELNQIRENIEQLIILPINEKISSTFIELMLKYSLSHNLDLPDALIASTAIIHNLELFTLNVKHFRYIDNLRLWQ